MEGGSHEQTVVFADVVGSTRLGETLDPETLREVMHEVVAAVVLAVEAHGGAVKDIAGDGVLALFDDPLSGAAAAATIVRAIEELKGAIASALAIEPPDVRVGAYHGEIRRVEVVAGSHRGLRVVGAAVDGAVALEAAAAPGTALVNDAVAAVDGVRAVLVDGVGQCARFRLIEVDGPEMPMLADLRARGHAVGAAGEMPDDERRPIVALFAAIVPAVGGDGPLDDRTVGAALDAAASTVERFGGHVKDMAGDVVVAVFGAPVAHEDDVDRALGAALACVRKVRAATGGEAAARCGVATGRVIVGSVGAGCHREYSAVGDAMNTAARVQAQTPTGRVLATAGVRRLAGDAVIWGEQRDLVAKGKAEPVTVFEVVEAGAAGSVGAEVTLVGRERELAVLIDRVRAGVSVVVTGDAGCGKSSLVDAAQRTVGGAWLACRPRSWERVEHLRAITGLLGTTIPPGAADDMTRAADRMLRDVLLASASAGAPVVRVDDLQHADAASLDVLARLVTEPLAGVCIVATARAGAGDGGDAAPLLAAVEQLDVAPLDERAAGRLLAATIGHDTLPYDIEAQVLSTASGNPLFLLQLAQALVERGLVARDDDGRWHYAGGASPEIPDSLERVVLARLDAIGGACRAVANAAAVLRDDISVPVLAEMCTAGLGAGAAVVALERAEVLVRSGEHFEFAQPLVRESVYAALLRKERQRLHHAAAVALGPDAAAARLARHWSAAGMHHLAMEPARRAAGEAEGRGSFEEAAELWEIAAKGADVVAADLTDRADLALRAGRARHAAGQLDDALVWSATAADLAADGQLMAIAADAAVEYEDALFATRRPRAAAGDRSVELLERARGIGFGEPSQVARVYAALGRAVGYGGDACRARSLTERAVAVARACGDASDMAYALLAWRTAREGPADLSARLATGDELVSAAARAGDRALEVDVRRLVFMDQLTAGRVEEAFAELPALIERVEALRQVRFAWYPPMWRAMHALATGDLDGAAHFIDDVREVGRRSRYADVAQVYALQTFLLHRARGGGGLAEVVPDAFHAAAALARGRWEVFWAALAAATGDSAEARTHLDVVLADRSRLGGERVLPAAVALLTDAVELLGDARAAAVLHGELRPWRGQFALVGSGAALLGPVDHYLDRLAAVAGDAIDH